jgi:hypothetical protein
MLAQFINICQMPNIMLVPHPIEQNASQTNQLSANLGIAAEVQCEKIDCYIK